MLSLTFDRISAWPGGLLGCRVIPVLLLMSLASGCHPQSEPSDGTAGLEKLVQDWVEMWNTYDLDQVQRLFLDDQRLTYFSSEKEGIIRGMDAVLEHHRGFGFVRPSKRPCHIRLCFGARGMAVRAHELLRVPSPGISLTHDHDSALPTRKGRKFTLAR